MEVFKKAFLAGLGALSLSQERTQAIIEELVKTGKLKEKEGQKLFKEMMSKAMSVKKDVETKVNAQVDAAVGKFSQTTLVQLKKLERRIVDLEKKRTAAPGAGAKRKSAKR